VRGGGGSKEISILRERWKRSVKAALPRTRRAPSVFSGGLRGSYDLGADVSSPRAASRLTVPGTCVLVVRWPLGLVVVVLRIFFFLRSSSRCSFCRFCTSISSEMKLFFTCLVETRLLDFRRFKKDQTDIYF